MDKRSSIILSILNRLAILRQTMSTYFKADAPTSKGSSPNAGPDELLMKDPNPSRHIEPEPPEREPDYGPPSMVYMQILFWLAQWVTDRAERMGVTTDQLIEEHGINIRKVIDPNWRPEG